MHKSVATRLFIIIFLLIISFALILPLNEKINLGLDLKGGMHLIMKVDTSKIKPEQRQGAAQRALEIIRNRIDQFGVKEPLIQPQGHDQILIQLPGIVDRERALNLIGQTALLEFRLVESDPKLIEKQNQEPSPDYEFLDYIRPDSNRTAKLLVKKEPELTGSGIEDAQVRFDSMGFANVSLRFNSQGSTKFAEVTEKNVGKNLAIVLDGKVKSAPTIQEPILSGEAQITGNFSTAEAQDLALVLRSGSLPCPMYIEEERTIGPLLGVDSIKKGIKAMAISALAVSLFMIFYYLLGGIISVFALGMNLVLILAGLNLLHATLTLPGIAGIILTLGMTVNANVLIFERIKEELKLKKPLSIAVKLGYEKAFTTIFDSNFTTFLAALCLFAFGTGPIKGFGVTLMLGILSSMFTALVFTRVVFDILLNNRWLKSLPMANLLSNTHINFISKTGFCLTVSAILMISGIFIFFKNNNSIYDVDFAGGQIQEYAFHQDVNINDLRKAFLEEKIDANIYSFKDKENILAIRTAEDSFNQTKQILDKKYLNNYEILRVEKVGPVVGKLLKRKAIMAILFALLGILIYVRIRFKHLDFALAAVAALFHDVIIGLSFAIFLSFKINLLMITALLTIAGYSINDTIVIYDRIRELTPKSKKFSLKDIINLAINQTLPRTIITSLTTLLVVICIYFLGPYVLKGFSFTLLIGFMAGVYSSVYIAAPLVIFFKRK